MRFLLFILSLGLFGFAAPDTKPSLRKTIKIIRNGDSISIKEMLNAGLDVNTIYKDGSTMLHLAAKYEKYDIVKILVVKGAKLDIQDNSKRTALMISTSSGYRNDSIAEYLVNSGANINIVGYYGSTALRNTIRIGTHSPNIRIFKLLVEKGADVNYSCSTCCDITPLMLCSSWGTSELVRVVLEKKVPVNQADCEGRSALIWAVHFNEVETVKLLLKAGADVHQRDKNQKAAMDYVLDEKNEAIIKLLYQK